MQLSRNEARWCKAGKKRRPSETEKKARMARILEVFMGKIKIKILLMIAMLVMMMTAGWQGEMCPCECIIELGCESESTCSSCCAVTEKASRCGSAP